jgi:hypothetical protein
MTLAHLLMDAIVYTLAILALIVAWRAEEKS